MTMLSDFLDSVKETLMPTIHADEGEKDEGGEQGDSDDSGEQEASEDGEEREGSGEDAEEEEEEEPVDPADQIKEVCQRSYRCKPLLHHYEHCNSRVSEGKDLIIEGEDCTEELFHLLHCVDSCAAPKIFRRLV